MKFVHLHVHSEYSLLDGLIKIPDLVSTVKEQGMGAVALTDHGVMYGAFQFYCFATDANIKPIIGVEAYKTHDATNKHSEERKGNHHITLLAKSYEGYKNLMKLVSEAHLNGFHYKPRIDFTMLSKYHKGLIILSGCLNGEISQNILKGMKSEADKLVQQYKKLLGNDFYIELQRIPGIDESYQVTKELITLSRKHNVPIVATNDVHYLSKDDAYAQEVLLCIQTGRTIHEKQRALSMLETPEFYLKSEDEMKGLFIDVPDAIENTSIIADSCNVSIPYGEWILPKYDIPKGQSADTYLKQISLERARKKINLKAEVIDRLNYELDIISKKGYSAYFLITQDFVNWAKNNGIAVGPGRGSAAGSLVAYSIGITGLNPLDYNLPFERFLNPDRPSPPDFDIDFADSRRDEVLEYVTNKYGKDRVAQIITFGRMEARLSVRDVARALGHSYAVGDRIAKMIPVGKQGFAINIEKAMEVNPQLKLAYTTEEETKQIVNVAMKLEGIARHTSVHAAGVIIADKNLTEYVPLQRESKGDRIITQYDMYSLDLNAVSDRRAIGLLKADFLGLRNLTIIENAIKFVKDNKDVSLSTTDIPLDDSKTYDLISQGRTIGVFQLESRGMQQLAKDLNPTKISDITAMVALYRPGPMELIPTFLEGKRNPKKIRYLHKDLVPILKETYGVLVYQEQVMEIAHKLAGFTMSEADMLRLAVGKKKKKLMEIEKKKFVQKCLIRGYTASTTEKIFSFIEKFASYGFNKPHSASYGLIAYWTAYMKANYTVEYMTALLTAELQGTAGSVREAKVFQAIEDTREYGIEVLPPNINKSEYDFTIENGKIRFGLNAIKNVGNSAISSIIKARSMNLFTSIKDFLERVDLQKVNKKTVESLIYAGAFDYFGSRASHINYYPSLLKDISYRKKKEHSGQFSLFLKNQITNHSKEELPNIEELDENELIQKEREVVGFSISRNPLSRHKTIIEKKISKKIGELDEKDIGKIIILAGTISSVKKVTTKKNNNQMAFVTVYDETGLIEAIVFPGLFEKYISIWAPNTTILMKGRIDQKDGHLNMLISDAVDLSRIEKHN